jgi:3-dehydroquinate synthase
MVSQFKIQEQIFSADAQPIMSAGFTVVSSPRSYLVDFVTGSQGGVGQRLISEIQNQKSPLLIVDSKIKELYLNDNSKELASIPTFVVTATEDVKEISTVIEIVDFLERNSATKTSMLYVVGGGIIQDLGAFSGAMYKRGLPWTFAPTTLLAQGDSCVGGKTALNHKRTKNLLALFSAPQRVIIDTRFLNTLPKSDILSGAGEIFRLCITGGCDFLDVFAKELPAFLQDDPDATSRLIATSLSAKRAIVEFDEFELDLRRSMNYGHSFGHALEALSDYRIPHGVGVTLGILVENQIAHQRNMLSTEERDLILKLGRQIIPPESLTTFADTSLNGVLDLLRRDKKTEGTVLRLATLESIGQMRFIDFPLNALGEQELRLAVKTVLASL